MIRFLAVLLLLGAAPTGSSQRVEEELGIRWVEVEAGTFRMGEGATARDVTVERFLMSATEVTFASTMPTARRPGNGNLTTTAGGEAPGPC